ncbi:MAG: hypothetical protein ACOCVF_03220 [bacterium]
MFQDTIFNYSRANIAYNTGKSIEDVGLSDIEKELSKISNQLIIENYKDDPDYNYYRYSNNLKEYSKKVNDRKQHLCLLPHVLISSKTKNFIYELSGELNPREIDFKKKSISMKVIQSPYTSKVYNGNSFSTSYINLNIEDGSLLTYFTYLPNKASFRVVNGINTINYTLIPKFKDNSSYLKYVEILDKEILSDFHSSSIVAKKYKDDKGKIIYYHPVNNNFISDSNLRFKNKTESGFLYTIFQYMGLVYKYMLSNENNWDIEYFYLLSSEGDVKIIKFPKLFIELSKNNSLLLLIKCLYFNDVTLKHKHLHDLQRIDSQNFIEIINSFNHIYNKNVDILIDLLNLKIEKMDNKNLINELTVGINKQKSILYHKAKENVISTKGKYSVFANGGKTDNVGLNREFYDKVNKKYNTEIVTLKSKLNNVKTQRNLFDFFDMMTRRSGYQLSLSDDSIDIMINLSDSDLKKEIIDIMGFILNVNVKRKQNESTEVETAIVNVEDDEDIVIDL